MCVLVDGTVPEVLGLINQSEMRFITEHGRVRFIISVRFIQVLSDHISVDFVLLFTLILSEK